MNDTEWFTIAGEAVIFCASLAQKIKTLKQRLQSTQEELTRLKTFLKDLEERHGYDTLLKKMDPGNFSSNKEFIRALLIEALANTDFTFGELNYNLYALNKEIFNQLNKETTAFFKFLHRKPDVDYKMKE